LIVSSFSAVDHARLYYREIEKAKIFVLIKSCGNYDALFMFPRKAISFVGTKIDLFLCTTKPSFVN
jgi:hypothetical protein